MHNQIDPLALKTQLKHNSITLIGLMGVGKTTIGRNLAQLLQLPFYDSDDEIEASSSYSVKDLFIQYGEIEFRALEKRVVARILKEKPIILASGGGAFIHNETRHIIQKHSITIWLKADLDILLARLQRRDSRPMLIGKDPKLILQDLSKKRKEFYNQANIKINCGEKNKAKVTIKVLQALHNYFQQKNDSL